MDYKNPPPEFQQDAAPSSMSAPPSAFQGEVTMKLRALFKNREAGVVIGTGGVNVKRICAETSADVRIEDSSRNQVNKAASFRGTIPQVKQALKQAIGLLHDKTKEHVASKGFEMHDPTLTLLFGNEVIGAVLGHGGARITALRESTGATIKVSTATLDFSTEKTVEIRGPMESLHRVIDEVVAAVATTAIEGHVPETRKEWGSSNNARGGGGDYDDEYHAHAPPRGGGRDYYDPRDRMDRGRYDQGDPRERNTGPSDEGAPRAYIIPVNASLVGNLLGKGGAKIGEIRDRSRAEVKIEDQTTSAGHRNVHITGPDAAARIAVNLVYETLGQPSPLRR